MSGVWYVKIHLTFVFAYQVYNKRVAPKICFLFSLGYRYHGLHLDLQRVTRLGFVSPRRERQE